jgi:NDP-sugar pyrophosphorylase family protein
VHGLILAGGQGSRLAGDGLTRPKAFVEIAGTPQLLRLVEQFAALGCTNLTCMVRDDALAWLRSDDAADVARRLETLATLVPCRTPSSLHTFVAGLAQLPPGNVFATMVDSVMLPNDWRMVYERSRRHLERGADAVLAVTPHEHDDDAPLWVRVDDAERVVTIAAQVGSPETRVTGGVYAFAPGARARAEFILASGHHRMRVFLGELVDGGARVMAVDVPRIFDIDHRRDLERANAYMMQSAIENTPAGES